MHDLWSSHTKGILTENMVLRAFALSVLLLLSALPEPAAANEHAFKAFIKEIKQEAKKEATKTRCSLDNMMPNSSPMRKD